MKTEVAMTPSVAVGARCYVSDAEAAWLPVYVEEVNEPKRMVTVRVQRAHKEPDDADHDHDDRSGERRVVAMDVAGGFPLQNAQLTRSAAGLDNMIELNHLHEAAILRNLKKRFRARRPYTYTGEICLAVNPYQWLNELYSPELHAQYLRASSRQDLPPHVYAVSVAAYRHMRESDRNQSILVSGESGAGKTETTKILMDNLATIASSSSSGSSHEDITTRIIQVNPLLESFGNAKTTRNDNSSRFGKFTQLQFDRQQALVGAQCETYLLEKTRVISHERGERNYHIFYQLLHGAAEAERDALALGDDCPRFAYLRAQEPQQITRPGHRKPQKSSQEIKPESEVPSPAEQARDRTHFAKTKQALTLLGLNAEQQHALFQTLSGILHLGEAQFTSKPENDEACELVKESVKYSSLLLGLDPTNMAKALCHRTMKAAGDVYLVPLTAEQARSGRDALAKAIYASVFEWLVAGINASLGAAARRSTHSIGVLDIFGFESFEHNSFEQLCINYANEKLQHKFTQDVFKAVQDEYEREHITWAHIAYADNSDTLALLEGRMGVMALLNEEVVRPRGNEEGFVSKLSTAYRNHKTLIDFPRLCKTQFAIHHYAGSVLYDATGFLEKHKDALLSDLSGLMCGSSEPFTGMLFLAKKEAESARQGLKSGGSGRKLGGGRGSGGSAGDKTVGMQFKQSLTALMATINETNVHYIRCIKPNSVKSATVLDAKMVATQLRCAGVIEAICIARAGYPNRLLHAEFAAQFELFLSPEQQQQQREDGENFGEAHCRALVTQFQLETPEEFQMGATKIYLQKGVLETLERAKAAKLFAYVALIQSQWRGMQARCRYYEMRDALIVIQQRVKVFVAICRFQRAKLAVATIQRVYRGHVGRRVFFEALCEFRAMQIQRTWRGRLGRQIFFAALCQSRALRLQCFARQFLARKELQRRHVAWQKRQTLLEQQERQRLRELEAERARQRKLEADRRRELEAEQARQRKLEAERRRELEAEQARQRKLEAERQRELERLQQEESALLIQKNVRGYFARCLLAEMAEEAERRRLEEEEERTRLRLQREQEEREAQRRAAEQAALEKKRLAE
ncbi:hypothetical protein BBJ28_00019182, partial [Nothophytophthora sp. Chile5]